MQQKAFTLHNRGMNRDLSVSKAGESSAYENHNIRITATDHDTLLSVTNERGNKEINLGQLQIKGELIGWNVLNNHIILFTHEELPDGNSDSSESNDVFVLFAKAINQDDEGIAGGGGNIHDYIFDDENELDDDETYTGGGGSLPDTPPEIVDPGDPYDVDPDEAIDDIPDDAYDEPDESVTPEPYDPEPEPEAPLPNVDHIYRIDYENGEFVPYEIFNGNLGFDVKHPIESVVYFETENIQKIYWVDGIHVLRFMNFMADSDERENWDNTYFDSNRIVDYGVQAEIQKDNSGNPRANGVIQYILSYFNKHGQETGYAWVSDFVYLTPPGRGGAGDENNSNKVYISFSGLDTRFTNFRVYSVFRSSVNGEAVAYIVGEGDTGNGSATIIDDGAHQSVEDASRLLYLGSKDVHAGTLEHKDQTLFLGDLRSVGKSGYENLKKAIKDNMFSSEHLIDGKAWESSCIEFMYSSDTHESGLIKDIPYPDRNTTYQYDSQLELTSSNITMFKGGEKYRFALVFRDKNGSSTDAFWIGDAVNRLYPVIDITKHRIRRPVVKCTLPALVVEAIRDAELSTVQLMIAEASYADRSVKAQGIVNPTMFNIWERFSDRLYCMPSWISRPRWSNYSWRHFEPVRNANGSNGEIQCNRWSDEVAPYPYYRLKDYNSANPTIYEKLNTVSKANYIMLLYRVRKEKALINNNYAVDACVVSATLNEAMTAADAIDALNAFTFSNNDYFDRLDKKGDSVSYADPNGYFELVIQFTGRIWGSGNDGEARAKSALVTTNDRLINEFGVDSKSVVSISVFMSNWYGYVSGSNGRLNKNYYWNVVFDRRESLGKDVCTDNYSTVFNFVPADKPTVSRWLSVSPAGSGTAENSSAYYRKHLMFVDENVVTLNSPEIDYNAVSLDNVSNHKFRIVGVAKVSSYMSDYTVDASHGYLSGENLVNESFSPDGDGLLAWPLWMEKGLTPDGTATHPESLFDYTSEDYLWGGSIVRYWLYMWNHAGIISGYSGEKDEEGDYSRLHSKVFANLRFCPSTIYNNYLTYENIYDLGNSGSIRVFNYPSSQYIGISVGDETKYYDGWINTSLSLPSSFRYPIYYSTSVTSSSSVTKSDSSFLYTNEPVPITFASNAHAVITLPSEIDADNNKYIQELLPYAFASEAYETPGRDTQNNISDAIVPWVHGLTCVAHSGIVGEFKVIQNGDYSEEFENISIYRTIVGSVVNLSYVRGWVKGIDHYGSNERVYDLIPVEDGYTYLVDVSNVHISDDMHTVSIVGAHVVAREETGVSGKHATVHFGNIDGTTMVTTNDAYTLSVVDVGTSQVVQTLSSTPFIEYGVSQEQIKFQKRNNADMLEEGDKYLLIGEVYYDFDENNHENDTRYGGISEAAIESNRFVPAGPQFAISKLRTRQGAATIYGNQGDTYFQRWDCLKTKPLSSGAANGVIDVTSLMVETHINIDGRYDNLRGTSKLASIDAEKYGQINPVYSQIDNFIATRELDDDFDQDAYRSYITWTLDKADSADIDEWTHVTLSNVLKLDGDKGVCTAIRRFQNSLIAFQDRAISEILFNSRTQLSTTDGVPIEIANSGKVDGKRYITNKYGCTNKWSIVEGKVALYFVDNMNKAFCAFNGNVENLSIKFGFGSWFRRFNTIEPWTPDTFENLVSFYDRVNSDVYLVGEDVNDERSTLVYNETIGAFTSFYDYDAVPMMANVEDRFVSYRDNKLWLQNEGFYCNFFGNKYDYWVQYRVTPDPYGDKIWTNIEYRADFYRVLSEQNGEPVTMYRESEIIAGDLFDDNEGVYQEDTTFDNLRMWNEYQKTEIDFGKDFYKPDPARKKFRIWRLTVPRAMKSDRPSDSNKYGLDRMRNPWINLKFTKKLTEDDDDQKKDLMQLHDITVRYFE